MEEIIKSGKDFRIIPENIEYSTTLEVLKIENYLLSARLEFLGEDGLKHYLPNQEVEVFGSSDEGLIYFRARIVSTDGDIISLAIPNDFAKVQRREYSRIEFAGLAKLINEKKEVKTLDISAGGVKFLCKENLTVGKNYDFSISLDSSKEILCSIQPMRVHQVNSKEDFVVSARFSQIKSADRVAIVQYSFRKIMELENSLND